VGDTEGLRAAFEGWLRDTTGAARASVDTLTIPGSGMSNDTFLAEAAWGDGARGIVLRLAPEGRGLFPRYELGAQVELLRGLATHGEVPVPEVLWWEPDPGPLGRPFVVMAHVDGRIPPDGHHFGGWVAELEPEGQSRLLDGALDVLGRIHGVDPDTPSLGVLDRPEHGATPIEQELRYWRDYLDWASDGDHLARLEDAYSWCIEHRPPDAGGNADRTLVWGDARLGNLVVGADLAPVAVLDWEMAVLGPPELDLGWFLFLDRTALQYTSPLPGFPDRAGIVKRYERGLGRPVRDLDWYEAWGGFRAACIQVRLAETPDARERNPVTKALRGLLA
jgi:aminoglycoside phosphotransferase (APT) family kinase protein